MSLIWGWPLGHAVDFAHPQPSTQPSNVHGRRVRGLPQEAERRMPKEIVLDQQRIDDAWRSSGRDEEVLVRRFRIEISRADIRTLRDRGWLNDNIIDFYGQLLQQRSDAANGADSASSSSKFPRIHVFTTHFYTKLAASGYAGVERWLAKTNLLDKELLLVPVHKGAHWVCCYARMHSRSEPA